MTHPPPEPSRKPLPSDRPASKLPPSKPSEINMRLSQIETLWSIVFDAKEGPQKGIAEAQEQLMQRYGGAVHRYLMGVSRDADVADELCQEFALRFLRGDFRRVSPERGRFRHFVKTAILNLVTDYHRRRKARPKLLSPESPEPAAQPAPDHLDEEFLSSWRDELLDRAWQALQRQQDQSKQPFYTALRLRADHPQLRSADLADLLSKELNKPVTANWVRQILHRARNHFAEFLVDDVRHTLRNPSDELLTEELQQLGLLEYCRPTGR